MPTEPQETALMELKVAARRLGIPASTLGERVRAKSVPHRRIGARVYFTQSDLDEILTLVAVTPAAQAPTAERGRSRAS